MISEYGKRFRCAPSFNYLHVAAKFSAKLVVTKFYGKYEPVLRFLIDSIVITYMLQPNLVLEDLSQNLWQI